MSFQMRCPKCDGVDFTIHMDRRCAASADKDFALVFSCRCGKQMFGTNVRDEYDRQKRQYEADEGARLEQERVREEQARREVVEAEVAEVSAPAPQVDAGSPEPVEVVEAPVVAEPEAAAPDADDEDSERCAWHQCSNMRRANSKYCSRSCSNKNARARHKKRKRTGDDDETAAA